MKKVNRQIYKHCDRKGIPLYFVCRGYNDAAVAKVAAVAIVNNAVVAVTVRLLVPGHFYFYAVSKFSL